MSERANEGTHGLHLRGALRVAGEPVEAVVDVLQVWSVRERGRERVSRPLSSTGSSSGSPGLPSRQCSPSEAEGSSRGRSFA